MESIEPIGRNFERIRNTPKFRIPTKTPEKTETAENRPKRGAAAIAQLKARECFTFNYSHVTDPEITAEMEETPEAGETAASRASTRSEDKIEIPRLGWILVIFIILSATGNFSIIFMR